MTFKIGSVAVIATLLSFLSGLPSRAEDVTLSARDGGLSVSGTLLSFDGSFYRVESEWGLLTLDAATVACDGPACPSLLPPKAVIRVAGDPRAIAALLPPLWRGFAASRGLRFQDGDPLRLLDANGATVAEISMIAAAGTEARAALLGGRADLILSASPEEGLAQREMAIDALVPVVSPRNTVPHIKSTDLARALTGEVRNWSDIGGPDMPLVLHALSAESDLGRALHLRLGKDVAADIWHADMEALALAVAQDPWALAVTGRTAVAPARIVPLRDSCGFPMSPDPMAVKSGDYPLTLPIFAQVPHRFIGPVLRDFLDFLSEAGADAAVAEAGYGDRGLTRRALLDDTQRLLNAIRAASEETAVADLQGLALAMDGAQRLSTTFRYEGGTDRLDPRSRSALNELSRLLAAGVLDGRGLVLVGFSDGSGAAAANLDLAQGRAEAVLAELTALLPDLPPEALPRIEAQGERLPIACDETGAGRWLNRRVELWWRPAPVTKAP